MWSEWQMQVPAFTQTSSASCFKWLHQHFACFLIVIQYNCFSVVVFFTYFYIYVAYCNLSLIEIFVFFAMLV